jgi:hypothetical protein
MSKKDLSNSIMFLQIAVSAYLALLGIVGIANYNSDLGRLGRAVIQAFGGRTDIWGLLVSILCVVSGAILLLGLFISIRTKLLYYAALAVGVFWLIQILFAFFLNNNLFEPEFLSWLARLSLDTVILAGIWQISRKYA